MGEPDTSARWTGRPRLAFVVKAIAWIAPIAFSILVTYLLAQVFPRPHGIALAIVWFVALSFVATMVLFAADKVARRLLPLAALFQLSLVFPDRAPSRFKSALRTQTVHQLEARVAEIKRSGLPDDPMLAAETLIDLIAALSAHDRLTRGHAERVRAYSRMIGEELKLDADDLDKLQWAGLLHDVGKLFVPGEILNKTGRLTAEEYDVIKKHPGWGAELCEPLRGWLGDWVDAVGQHHERWDGAGYPNGIAGEDIAYAARIVSVADVYDVITSVRSYKEAESAVDGREELSRCAGTQFDPKVVRAFLSVSLGRLRLAMGPLSWFAQLPIVGRVPLAPTAGAATSVGATAAALVAVGVLSQPVEPIDSVDAADVIEPVLEAVPEPTTTLPTPTVPPTTIVIQQPAPPPEPAPTTVAPPPTTDPPPTTPPTTTPATTTPPAAPPPTSPPTTTPPTTAPPTTTPPPPTTTPPPPPPTAGDDSATTDEERTVDIDVGTNDSGASLVTVIVQPAVGSVTHVSGTTLRYTPPPNWSGTTSFSYVIDDGTGRTATATVSVTVVPMPDPPVAVDDTATTDEGSAVNIAVLANDTDPDGDPLTVTSASSPDGTAITDGTSVAYQPAPHTHGTHTVTYTIDDGTGRTDTATVTVTVDPISDDPVANADSATTNEDTTVVVPVLANDTDPDGDPLTVTTATSADGTATTDGTTVTYTPDPDSNGSHTVTYTVDDGTGRTDAAVVSIEVIPRPDHPVADDDTATTDEDTTVVVSPLLNDSDPDGDPLTITGATSADGTPTTDGSTVTYTPAPDSNGTHTVTYTVDDGTGRLDSATITITVNPTPDDPIANDDSDRIDEDTTSVVAVLANDVEPDGETMTVISASTSDGTATTDGTTVTFTPAPNKHGTYPVSYTVDDGTGRTDSATVTVTVDPIPDDPIANDDAAATDEDKPVVISVLANDVEPDGETMTVTTATSPDGTATTDGTTVTYTPDPDEHGTHTVTYTIDDGTGRTDSATITITVAPIPDDPVAIDDAYLTDQGVALVIPVPGVLDNDFDVDGDPLTAAETVAPNDGTLTLLADGSFTYTPDPLFTGTDQFEYSVDDGTGRSDTAAVTITVSSTSTTSTLYFGTTGPWPWQWDLSSTAPATANPEPDHDGDGDPGLTIDRSSQSLFDFNPAHYQHWTFPISSPLVLDGPVSLDLWSTTANFVTNRDVDYSIWLFDCDGTLLFCTELASEVDVHVNDWNGGVADFVNRQITFGSVDKTVASGRVLLVRLMFGHRDVWVAASGDRPTSLQLTQ